MKKLSYRRKKWLLLRAKNEGKRRQRKKIISNGSIDKQVLAERNKCYKVVKMWQGGDEVTAICTRKPTTPPFNLCFRNNMEETIKFFETIRDGYSTAINLGQRKFIKRANSRSIPRITSYSDFSKIENISMASALVLAADYDRISHFLKEVPPTIDLKTWKPVVITKLYQMGFFNILGHKPSSDLLVQDGDFLLMQIVRSKDSEKLNEVYTALRKLGRFISVQQDELDEKIIHTLSIISEVMVNVTQHAYPDDIDFSFRHLDSFWVSAEANKSQRTLRIVLYDQGATIPVTYPKTTIIGRAKRFLARTISASPRFDFQNDGIYIRTALRYGRSRTEQDYRGKGFPQMAYLLDKLGGGELRIYSRGGWCVRDSNGKFTSDSHVCSIGGTLVEWTFEFGNE